ncbi:MAG: hypothetical protein R6U17_00845 [Thermoplasmata archaeon]
MNESDKVLCMKCGSEVIVSGEKCPICGENLFYKNKRERSEEELALMDKVKTAYNLVYCAEHMDVDTRQTNELIVSAREEIDAGELNTARDMITKGVEHIIEPLEKELKKDLRKVYKLLRTKEVFGGDISHSKEFLKKANAALDREEYEKCLTLLEHLKKDLK